MDLAIVIPAYKPDFFAATLASLEGQTDRRFRVYVGDDASPADLRAICTGSGGGLDLHYHRFGENLGQRSLAGHWNRCVALSGEPWVWLFSDDDVLEPGCVEAFHRHLAAGGQPYDLYHFNTAMIDAQGALLRTTRPFAAVISGADYAANRLALNYSSFAAEYVFARAAWEREGGFVDFPTAWCSDDASWIAFSGSRGIRTIEGPLVRWRLSGRNISSAGSPHADEKVEAMLAYLRWLGQRLGPGAQGAGPAGSVPLRSLYADWFFAVLAPINPRLGLRRCRAIARELIGQSGGPAWSVILRLARNELRATASAVKSAALRLLARPAT